VCSRAVQAEHKSNPVYFLRHIAYHQRIRRDGLTAEDLLVLWVEQNGRCALTGRIMTTTRGQGRMPTNASVDRIDSSRGYKRGNVRLVQLQINLAKGEWTDEQLLELARDIISHARRQRQKS
jgi:hypothetical protein